MPARDDLPFEQYLRGSFAELVARLRGTFPARVAAEDAVQEALIRAWQLSARGEPVRALEPWMTVAATNLARSRSRKLDAEDRALRKVAMNRSGDPPGALGTPASSILRGDLAWALGQLPPRQVEMVVLHYYGDLTMAEIARRLGVSVGTVKRTLHDARAALRGLVGRDTPPPSDKRRAMTGWHMAGSHPRQYEHARAEDMSYDGRPVAHLRCVVARADGFGTLMQTFSAERYHEQRVRFSGALKCEDVGDRVGLWMRVDGPGGTRPLAFDNMADRPISGTTDWQRYEVVLDVPAEAQAIALGVLLIGEGEAWVADFRVETVGLDVETTDVERSLPDRPANLDFSEEFSKP